MRVLVTGAGGFVGRHLVPHLQQCDHEVRATSLDPPQSGDDWDPLDLTDQDAVRRLFARVEPEGVIHLAAQASVGGSWDDPNATYRSNIIGTGNLLEAAKGSNPRVLLVGSAQQYVSSGGRPLAEGDPQAASSPYSLTKVVQEQMGMMYLNQYGIESIFTRSFNHTGPGQSPAYAVGSFASQIARLELVGGGEMHVGNLDSRRDFLDVRDVVRAYRLLLERGEAGEAYNVCSGVSVRMGDLLGKLLEISTVSDSVQIHEQKLHVSAVTDELVGDPSKISNHLGWAHEIPLERSLGDTLDWYRSTLEDTH